MKRLYSIVMVLIFLGMISSASAEQGSVSPGSVPQQSTQSIEMSASEEGVRENQYREAVIKHMAQGETVSVPADKIGCLRGVVRLVAHKYQPASIKATKTTEPNLNVQIEALADTLKDPEAKKAFKSFAVGASEKEKIEFLYFGKTIDLRKYAPPMKAATAQQNCYESCQTLCNVSCHETCTWDCRIFHGEQVCTESCKTICPEVCNLVCHWTCR